MVWVCVSFAFPQLAVAAVLAKDHVKAKDMMKKSIVFDKNTPDVFYCPLSKPTGKS